MNSKKVSKAVTPANTGVPFCRGGMISLDSRVRGNDENGSFLSFYEFVKITIRKWGSYFIPDPKRVTISVLQRRGPTAGGTVV